MWLCHNFGVWPASRCTGSPRLQATTSCLSPTTSLTPLEGALHQAITASYRAASIPMRAIAQSLKTKRPRWLGRSPLCATAPPAHMSPIVVQSLYRAHPATLGGPAPLRLARLLPGNNPIPALPSTTRAMRSPPISTQSPPVSSSHHSPLRHACPLLLQVTSYPAAFIQRRGTLQVYRAGS